MLLETQRIIKGTNGELWEVEDVPFDSRVGPRICIALSPGGIPSKKS
jgi:DNA-directed RNA polymerase beta subunit